MITWGHWFLVGFSSWCRPIAYWHWSDIVIWYVFPISYWCCSDNVAQYKTSCYSDTIFNVEFIISNDDENTINNGKHVWIQLSKCSDKLYGNIVYTIQIKMNHFIQAPGSLALCGKCPNIELFLVRIFRYSDKEKLRIWTLFTQCCICHNFRILIFEICGENIQRVKNKLLQFCKTVHLNIGDITSHWPTFKIIKNKILF